MCEYGDGETREARLEEWNEKMHKNSGADIRPSEHGERLHGGD